MRMSDWISDVCFSDLPPGGDEAGGAVCAATNWRGKGSSEANLRTKLQRGSMLHRKRILFAINSLAGGGAERVLATLLAGSEPWRARYDIHQIGRAHV